MDPQGSKDQHSTTGQFPAANLDQTLKQRKAPSACAPSLLESSLAEQQYVATVRAALASFGTEYVQRCDENKRPPLEVLARVRDDGVYVAGVPLPPLASISLAHPLLAYADAAQLERLRALAEPNATRELQREQLASLDQIGRARAMTLASLEMAKCSGIGVGTFLGVSSGLSAFTIAKVGTPEQQALWLNALHHGVFTYAFALTEPGAGSDPRSMRTTFTREVAADGQVSYRLNGSKKFIGNAARVQDHNGETVHPGADFILVFAVDDPAKAPADRSFRAFMVPRSAIGEEHITASGGAHNKMGLREVNNGDFVLQDVIVPESALLGRAGEDMYGKLLGTLDITRLFVGAMGLGTAEAALEAAKGYGAVRVQNGRTIEDFQLVGFPLRLLETQALGGKLLLHHAAQLVDQAGRQTDDLRECLAAAGRKIAAARSAVPPYPQLAERLSAMEQALEEMAKGPSLRHGREAFLKAAEASFAITNALRKGAAAPEDARPIKDAYKLIKGAADELRAARDPVRFGLETAMAKLYNSELAEAATKQAINTLGGNGFLESPAEGLGLPKRYRDSKVLTIYEGTSNIQRNIIAQGEILRQLKEIKDSVREGLKMWLLGNESTNHLRYAIMNSRSHTPLERVESGFKYAMAKVLVSYKEALAEVVADWKRDGVPAEFSGWDARSLERQQNLLASFKVQARMGILADMAVQQKICQLAEKELKLISARPHPADGDAELAARLKLLQAMTLEDSRTLGRKLGSITLRQLEKDA